MVEWMRAHNANPAGTPRISFHGFDLQYIDVATEHVLAYLRGVDPATAASAQSRYTLPSPPHPPDPLAPLRDASPGDRVAYLADAQAVYDDLAAAQARYEAASSSDSYADALRNARIVVQGVDTLAALGRKEYGHRDAYMAENVSWLLDRAGMDAKLILWAHNEHIGAVPAATDAEGVLSKTMGTWLRERYGTAIRVVGQTFYAGSCNAVEGILTAVTVPPPPADSYEAALHAVGPPRLMIDLRAIEPGKRRTGWRGRIRSTRSARATTRRQRRSTSMRRASPRSSTRSSTSRIRRQRD